MWRKNNYTTLSIVIDSDSDDDDDDDEAGSEDIRYVIGDVTQPQCTDGSGDAIVVHCVGRCGLFCVGRHILD